MNNKGITLIELVVVVAIIGILAVIAVPAYIGQQKNAQRSEAYSNLQNLRLLEEQYFAENGCYYKDGSDTCQNTTVTDTANIQVFLPGFKPGSSHSFKYKIITDNTGPGGGDASCFKAEAKGAPGTRVGGDVFFIDCNNERNF